MTEVANGYDARGLLIAAKNSHVGLLRDYDELGRLTRETDTRFGTGVAYQYSAASRLTAKVYPDGTLLHAAYDPAGRPVGITDPTGDTTRYVYDAAGRRVQTRSTANLLRTQLAYDAVGRLDTIESFRSDGTPRPLQSYPAYDDAGNRLSMLNDLGTTSYAYDALHRLETASPPGAPAVQYEYDRAGNRLHAGQQVAGAAWTQTSIYESPPTGGPSHRLKEIRDAAGSAVETFVYDTNGNPRIWLHPGQRFLGWDALDRLVSISGNFVGHYVYDPLGRRIEKTEAGETIRYQYDGLDVVAEYSVDGSNTNSLAATYVFGPGIDEPLKILRGATLAAYHSDGLGSILAVSSIATPGATDLLSYRYDAFGVIEASTGSTVDSTYTYTGRERDASGLYYYRARYYLASTGRFLSPDPMGLEGGINPYVYVGSNPVNFTDPFGLAPRAAPQLPPAFQSITPQGIVSFAGDVLDQALLDPFRHQGLRDVATAELANCAISACTHQWTSLVAADERLARSMLGATIAVAAFLPDLTALPGIATSLTARAPIVARETTVFYRAVSHPEAASLLETGAFQAGQTSYTTGKWFAESAEHATQWGTRLEGAGNFRIIEAEFPKTTAEKFMRYERLDGIGEDR